MKEFMVVMQISNNIHSENVSRLYKSIYSVIIIIRD